MAAPRYRAQDVVDAKGRGPSRVLIVGPARIGDDVITRGEYVLQDDNGQMYVAPEGDLQFQARRRPEGAPSCDCGAVKARTTHSHWCSTQEGR